MELPRWKIVSEKKGELHLTGLTAEDEFAKELEIK